MVEEEQETAVDAEAEAEAEAGPTPEWTTQLAELLEAVDRDDAKRLGGARISALEPLCDDSGTWCLEVALDVGGEPFELQIEVAQEDTRAYAKAGRFALSYVQSTPMDTKDKELAMDAMTVAIGKLSGQIFEE